MKTNLFLHQLPFSLLLLALVSMKNVSAQFPGAAGTPGTTAIYKDSSIFVGWASGCDVIRGYLDITDPGLGTASYGTNQSAIGQADGTDVVSLGDGGTATVTFAQALTDEDGFDFAVFENALNDNYLELGFVEVSSDGVQFFRFPATSITQTLEQIGPFDDVTYASELNNLAGKYRREYGTPFDLAELAGTPGLDIHSVTHVRIVDVVGSVDSAYATFDSNGNPINDPFPTPFPSSGFDLDAVGVIHQLPAEILSAEEEHFVLFPNPVKEHHSVFVTHPESITSFQLFNAQGTLVIASSSLQTLSEIDLKKGVYFVEFTAETGFVVQQLIVTE